MRSGSARDTDLPFLIRMDTLQPLRPDEVLVRATRTAGREHDLAEGRARRRRPRPLTRQMVRRTWPADFQPSVIGRWKEAGRRHPRRLGPGVRQTRRQTRSARADDRGTPRARRSRSARSSADRAVPQREPDPGADRRSHRRAGEGDRQAREQIARNPEKTLFATGMGPNQFFNADLKDRAILLVAALTRNLGFPGGNVGSYAGNYRAALFNGMPTFAVEDPFNLQLDPAGKARSRSTCTTSRSTTTTTATGPCGSGQHNCSPARATCPPDEGDVAQQLELGHRQREVALRRGQQHAAEDRVHRLRRLVVDGLVRVRGHGLRLRLVGRVQAPGHDGLLHQPVPADVPEDAAQARL
jgi:hypothetical protein